MAVYGAVVRLYASAAGTSWAAPDDRPSHCGKFFGRHTIITATRSWVMRSSLSSPSPAPGRHDVFKPDTFEDRGETRIVAQRVVERRDPDGHEKRRSRHRCALEPLERLIDLAG